MAACKLHTKKLWDPESKAVAGVTIVLVNSTVKLSKFSMKKLIYLVAE
jgi:hypothetical protein